MAQRHLRVYYGPESDSAPAATPLRIHRGDSEPNYTDRVTVPLREILSTLAEAVERRRGWVEDFADDDVTISTDLYEVILAYQHYQQPTSR
jgi:hypothetical protein